MISQQIATSPYPLRPHPSHSCDHPNDTSAGAPFPLDRPPPPPAPMLSPQKTARPSQHPQHHPVHPYPFQSHGRPIDTSAGSRTPIDNSAGSRTPMPIPTPTPSPSPPPRPPTPSILTPLIPVIIPMVSQQEAAGRGQQYSLRGTGSCHNLATTPWGRGRERGGDGQYSHRGTGSCLDLTTAWEQAGRGVVGKVSTV